MLEDELNIESNKLIAELLDGSITEEDHLKLQTMMKSNAEVRKIYLKHCQMVSSLKWEGGSLSRDEQRLEPIKKKTLKVIPFYRIASVACFFLACCLFLYQATTQSDPVRGESEIAIISGASGIEFKYGIDGSKVRKGEGLPSGDYTLNSGLLELKYSHGVKVVLEAPITFTLKDDLNLELSQGRITAKVPENVKGFAIKTPTGNIVDQGTAYAVWVDEHSIGQVHVFEGDLVVTSKNAKKEDGLHLSGGEATIVSSDMNSASSIDLLRDRFVRQLEEPESEYSQIVMENNPVLYFPMQPSENGVTLNDISKTGLQGTIHAAIGRPLWTAGRIGTCIRFEGPTKKGYAVVKDYPKTTNNTLSGAGWVYALSRPMWASIMKNWAGVHGQFHFGLYDQEGCLEIHIEDADGEELFVKDSIPVPLNEWHHVAFVADGKMLRLYRNGEEVDAAPYTSIFTNDKVNALAIGTKLNIKEVPTPFTKYRSDWHGRLDELSLFNHPISADVIEKMYHAGLKTIELN